MRFRNGKSGSLSRRRRRGIRVRVRASGSVRLTLGNKKKKIERSEERNVKNARSQRENGRERYIEKWRETPVRGSSAVIEGWPAILRVFPPPMAVALPTDALPPLPSTSLPISHLSKVPFLFLFLPSSHPFCHRVDVNSRVQILARSKFRTGN